MNKHPDCEDRCQLREHKGYISCHLTEECAYLYRATFEHLDGRQSRLTFAALRSDALRMAADLVRCYTGGYLLGLHEQRPLITERPQLKLV